MGRIQLLGLVALVLAVGGPADAALSANGRIAYSDGDTIRTVNPDGTGDRFLATGREPAWSPDGSQLAYVGPDQVHGVALFTVNAIGGDPHPLTAAGTVGNAPDWSPDANQLVFANVGDIYTIGVDGTGLRQLTAGQPYDQTPSWSPDGSTIAFARGVVVWLMNAGGGNERPLVEGSEPRFSPDGQALAFQNDAAIYVVRADGTDAPRRVTPEGQEATTPAWSPDGSQLAFIAKQGVCTVPRDGGTPRRVTFKGVSRGLDWQPRNVAASRPSPYSCFSPRWDLRLSITATRTRAAIGGYVQFRILLSNRGRDPATDTSFSISWPGETEFSAISGPCGPVDGERATSTHCEPGVVYPGRPVSAMVSVRMQAPGPQRIFVEMDEFSEPHDANSANDRDSARVLVGGCTITGTTGADVLTGTPLRDVICGLDGHDVIRGLGGNDEIWSGDREDVVEGGAGNDRIIGGDGNDDLDGGEGRDVVWGGLGKDTIFGGRGDDALHGSDRLDRFDPRFPYDTDVVDGGPGSDVVDGGDDEDTVRGGNGTDIVLTRDGLRDHVDCGRGRDRLMADRIDRQRHCERVSRR